jgi:DNA-binding IclR family transcriptional regulator
MRNADGESHINTSSETIFEALGELARTPHPIGISELQRSLGEPISSIHRALATLEEAYYAVRYEGTAKFVPGPMCFHLVRALVNRFQIRKAALPTLRALAAVTEGSATLNVRLGWFSLRVASAEGRIDYYQGRRVGEARLLHEDVAPLSMLSASSDRAVADYRAFIARRMPSRIHEALSPSLDRIITDARERGYVVRPDRERPDRSWAGVPLSDGTGAPFAAISVVLPETRTSRRKAPDGAMQDVLAVAADLQRQVLEDAALSQVPFSHIPADELILPLPQSDVQSDTPALENAGPPGRR